MKLPSPLTFRIRQNRPIPVRFRGDETTQTPPKSDKTGPFLSDSGDETAQAPPKSDKIGLFLSDFEEKNLHRPPPKSDKIGLFLSDFEEKERRPKHPQNQTKLAYFCPILRRKRDGPSTPEIRQNRTIFVRFRGWNNPSTSGIRQNWLIFVRFWDEPPRPHRHKHRLHQLHRSRRLHQLRRLHQQHQPRQHQSYRPPLGPPHASAAARW